MIKVAAGVILDGMGNVLLCSRPEDKPPAGWEFPGGKIEAGETSGEALCRELLEELSLPGKSGQVLLVLDAGNVELHFQEFFPAPGSCAVPREGQECFWYPIAADAPEKLLPNDLPMWEMLKKICN